MHKLLLLLLVILLLPSYASGTSGAQAAATTPTISYVFSSPITFATRTALNSYGFLWGPSDGLFGAIPASGGSYTFYGAAASNSNCTGTAPNAEGGFTFTGTLDRVTGSNGCKRLFGPGDGPAGWLFDKDYAGGGQVVPFEGGGKSGYLMPFHGEFHWKNMANPPSYLCSGGPCFYSSLGLAVSTDNGKSFKVVGQILQPSEPLSFFTGGDTNMAVGFGSLVVADAAGKHIDNPPADPTEAYFYLFFTDRSPGACATSFCVGVARASYADVVAAALSGDPHMVARIFHKHDGGSPNSWSQPATSDTPDLSGSAGKYTPLWSDEPGIQAEVIYDSSFDVYLAVYLSGSGVKVRASSDLTHWSEPIGPRYMEAGRTLYSPTLLGETGDPTIAGPGPRMYFSSFPDWPDWKTSVFESVQLTLRSISTTTSIGQTSSGPGSLTTSEIQLTTPANVGLLGLVVVVGLIVSCYFVLKRKKTRGNSA